MSFSTEEIEEFKAEAFDLLDTAEKSLLALDGGAEFRPKFDAIFRCFHNLKGSAGMMELEKLLVHTHELENILMGFKDKDAIPKEYIEFFLRGVDATKSILNGEDVVFDFQIKTGGDAVPTEVETPIATNLKVTIDSDKNSQISNTGISEFVAECEELVDRVSKNLQIIESNTYTKETIDSLYRDVHSLKGSAYLFSFNVLGDLSHAMESSLEKVREGTHVASSELLDVLFKSVTVVERILADIKTTSSDQRSVLLVEKACKALITVAGRLKEVPKESLQINESVINPSSMAESLASSVVTSAPAPSTSDREAEGANTIRVGISLLDNLMTLMGELVLARNQVLQYASKIDSLEFQNMSKRLNVVTSEIQGEMMKTRMQPIGNILSKFNRVVRDLSHELGKNIQLNVSGAETELDKSLLESIKDPLTHIVRNSCDHGIETPDIRESSGKSKIGTITIKAYHEGGQVVVEVLDDGKGLCKEAIVNKAVEKGIITPAQVSELSEKDAFNLIFSPGLSTAAKVTNVSGRGVGMDVVRTNIERIGGTVDFSSVEGKGTTIKIKVPLTLAIVPALLVKCNNETFAIPQVKLEELVRVDSTSSENKIEILQGVPVYRLRGNILPLVDLNKVLKIRKKETCYENSVTNIAVLNAEQFTFGLIIDEVMDTADIVVKPLNRLLKALQVYAGATVLGDGTVALILDVIGISKVAELGSDKQSDAHIKELDEKQKNYELQDFLLVKLNSPTKHALPLSYVHRLEEFNAKDVEYYGHQRVIRYRDAVLPLVSANKVLQYKEEPVEGNRIISVVVIKKADSLYGIEVNQILDTLSTRTSVELSHTKEAGIFGSLVTKEELFVVVDPFEMIDTAFPDEKKHTWSCDNNISLKNEPRKILVVEDTMFFKRAIVSALEKAGHKIVAVNDGREAIEMLEQENGKFDIIVSDIEMPRMNGFELAKVVRSHPLYSKIPMLAISSRADKNYTESGKKAGFNIYIEKLKTEVLLDAVAYLTNNTERVA